MALSRARLGLYILGRREVFESCYELKEAFDRLLKRSDRLMLVTGEVYPTSRPVEKAMEGTEMTGVEHLGQYVYEMTQAKIAQLGASSSNSKALPSVTEEEMLEIADKYVEEDDEVDETAVPNAEDIDEET